eukprot:scaffold6227_cov87-Isochrysis_galbana.AAC.2
MMHPRAVPPRLPLGGRRTAARPAPKIAGRAMAVTPSSSRQARLHAPSRGTASVRRGAWSRTSSGRPALGHCASAGDPEARFGEPRALLELRRHELRPIRPTTDFR